MTHIINELQVDLQDLGALLAPVDLHVLAEHLREVLDLLDTQHT